MPRIRKVEVRNIATVNEVLKLAGGVPRSTLQRWRQGTFPKPFKTIGRRVELWDLAQVRPWLAAREVCEAYKREEGEPATFHPVDERGEPGVFEIRSAGKLLGVLRVDSRGRGEWA